MNAATCSRTASTTRGALVPTVVTAMPEPRSMRSCRRRPPPGHRARAAKTGIVVRRPPATAAGLRARSSWDRGPGIGVRRRRSRRGYRRAGGHAPVVASLRACRPMPSGSHPCRGAYCLCGPAPAQHVPGGGGDRIGHAPRQRSCSPGSRPSPDSSSSSSGRSARRCSHVTRQARLTLGAPDATVPRRGGRGARRRRRREALAKDLRAGPAHAGAPWPPRPRP